MLAERGPPTTLSFDRFLQELARAFWKTLPMDTNSTLTPRLVVAEADRAIDFYREAFEAQVLERFEMGGRVVHAALKVFAAVVAVTEEAAEANNVAPTSLGGSAVILNLVVEDVDAVAQAFIGAGGEAVFPIADQFYGHREGRFRDPFGHLWIITTIRERLTPEEIDERIKAMES